MPGSANLDNEIAAAARAIAVEDAESLGALRYVLIQLAAAIGAVGLSAVATVGIFPGVTVRAVLVVVAVGCVVVFIAVRRARAVSRRFGLGFLSPLMAATALIAATIQPAPLGTLTGFVFLALTVCVAASEPPMVAVVFSVLAVALGLAAITQRSIVPIPAAILFVSATAVAVFVVIKFRMLVSDTRDRAIADALTDPLTGLGNRRRMDIAVVMMGRIADRSGQRVGCLIIDIDHFKSINDKLGHDVGDDVLRACATIITDTVRGGDLVIRLGGDEFAVFSIATSSESLAVMGERIRAAVATSDAEPAVTVSVGGTLSGAATPDDIRTLLTLADRALYGAKQAGRNAVNVD